MTRICQTCGNKFEGEHWKAQCRECFWNVKGFDWKCSRDRARHTPDDMRLLCFGGPVGSGMWNNGQVLMEIKLIGGFEQFSHETWDEIWRVKLFSTGLNPDGAAKHEPPIETSGSCLICAIKEAIAKAKPAEKQPI